MNIPFIFPTPSIEGASKIRFRTFFVVCLWLAVAAGLQACFWSGDEEPPVLSGLELKGLVPPLRLDTGTESISAREYTIGYEKCDIESARAYATRREYDGWKTTAKTYSEVFLVPGVLFRQTFQKGYDGRTITLNVRCADGYENKTTSRLTLSN